MTIGERMKQLRTENNLSQSAMARKIGISANSVSLYETDARVPAEKNIQKICEAFHVDKEWLLNGSSPEDKVKTKSGGQELKGIKKPRVHSSVMQPIVEDKPVRVLEEGNVEILIQSILGGTISTEEILARVYASAPDAEKIYVKPEENKAYYVGPTSKGYVLLWD